MQFSSFSFFFSKEHLIIASILSLILNSLLVSSSCQYGERCKFLHVTQQQPKANVFGFGAQTSSQFQRSNSQHQKPNPFGFGVQGSSQPRGATDFGSKQNQFKVLSFFLNFLLPIRRMVTVFSL